MPDYNPSKQTFIKEPKLKTCPACGQTIQEPVVPMNNEMNRYVNDDTGHVAVYNHGDPYITVAGVKLRREDVSVAASPPKSIVTPVPVSTKPTPAPAVVIPSAKLAQQSVKLKVGVTEGAPEPT